MRGESGHRGGKKKPLKNYINRILKLDEKIRYADLLLSLLAIPGRLLITNDASRYLNP
jgi:hypothetical protein